jgi:hypothetical protein
MIRRLFLLALFAALVDGCGNPNTPNPTQTGLAITGSLVFAALNQSAPLTALGVFSDGTRKPITTPVTWSVQDPAVATISSDGVVRTTGFGSTTVTATTASFTVTATLQVSLTVTNLTVKAVVVLSAAGQTEQLSAIATLVGGSTQDITSKTSWSSDTPQDVSVSSTGLLTANALGAATITAKYTPATGASLFRFTSVVVTPPGTFVATGRTRDPGAGSLPNVAITIQSTGQSTTSSTPNGAFAIGGLTDGMLTFNASGYDPVVFDTTTVSMESDRPSKFVDVPMQPTTRINAGGSISRTIAPHDMDFPQPGGSHCYPCQLVRVTTSDGTLHLQVTWAEKTSILNMWINGVKYTGLGVGPSTATADVAVGAGEVLVYVGQQMNVNANYTDFTLVSTIK